MKQSFAEWLIGLVGQWLNKESGPKKAYLTDYESLSYEIRPGDVLLIEGTNRISRVIRKITHSPWTHAALFIGRLHDIDNPGMRERVQKHYGGPPNTQLLIESMMGKGTIITPLSHYKEHHARICRPQGLSRKDAQDIIGYSIGRLGCKYSLRHIFDLRRFLVPYGLMPRRWRSSLFSRNALKPTEDICSSMIAHAFGAVRFPILPILKQDDQQKLKIIQRNPRIFVPSDFDYSPYFNIIKYPLFSLQGQSAYKDLPWKKGTVGVGDEEMPYKFDNEGCDIDEDKKDKKD